MANLTAHSGNCRLTSGLAESLESLERVVRKHDMVYTKANLQSRPDCPDRETERGAPDAGFYGMSAT